MPVIQPKDLAAHLSTKPVVLHVGFNVLYRNSKHIPGAAYAGPGRQPEGLATLKAAVEKLPRDRKIVIYCGCCPGTTARYPARHGAPARNGFKNVKALYLPEILAKVNWIDAGYPVEYSPMRKRLLLLSLGLSSFLCAQVPKNRAPYANDSGCRFSTART